jgi:hypothetical protein
MAATACARMANGIHATPAPSMVNVLRRVVTE